MLRIPTQAFRFGLVLLLAILTLPALSGCDAIDGILGDGAEVNGTVEAVGDNSVTVDAIQYTVNDQTTFKGISGLSDISVGDQIEVEYEERSGERIATEIEGGSALDSD